MKDNLKKTWKREKGQKYSQMEKNILVNIKMIVNKVLGHIILVMVIVMRVIGKMIYHMVKEKSFLLMDLLSKAIGP